MWHLKIFGYLFFGPIGGDVKLTIWHIDCQTDDKISILSKGQIQFKIFQSLTLPINHSIWIWHEAISKFAATSDSKNWTLPSFCIGLFRDRKVGCLGHFCSPDIVQGKNIALKRSFSPEF